MCQQVRPDESAALLKTYAGHEGEVNAARISPDGRFVVSASYDNTIRIWDSGTGLLRLTIQGPKHRYQDRGHTHWFSACAFSPDGGWLAAAGSDPTLKLYDARTGVELLALRGKAWVVPTIVIGEPDERVLGECANYGAMVAQLVKRLG